VCFLGIAGRRNADDLIAAGSGITISRQGRRLVTVDWLILPAGEFGPQNADLIWSFESEPHAAPFYFHYGNLDPAANDHRLAGLPAQNQHVTAP
jgi:hypothetical protein